MVLHRQAVVNIRACGAIMMAVAVGAEAMIAAEPGLIAIARILIDPDMGRGGLRRAGCGVGDRGDKEHGGDQGHSQNQFRPYRHRPGHRAVDTSIRAVNQRVTLYATRDYDLLQRIRVPATH